MNRISPLQLILLVVSGFAIVIAVLVFAFMRNSSGADEVPVVMWGTFSSELLGDVSRNLQFDNVDISNIVYEQKDVNTIEQDFVNALAEGKGPDLIVLSQNQIISNKNRIMVIPYESFPLRDYLNTFVPEAELFTTNEGIIGIPFSIDPLIMYWNRTLFVKAGIANPPKYWSEVMSITPRLTVSDSDLTISESAIALGEFRNVNHAKEILLNLILQAGNKVVVPNTDLSVQNDYQVILDERLGYTVAPAVASLNFFTQFSNPQKEVYSWNRSLPNSLDRFLAGDLAMYIGFSSEINAIREKNPNLDFDITTMPQSQNSEQPKVFGQMTALAISRASKNPQGAFNAAIKLTTPEIQNQIKIETGMPSVRRDLLQASPDNKYESVIFTSALWADGVREVDGTSTTRILQDMVESTVTGKLNINDAITRAQQEMEQLLNQ